MRVLTAPNWSFGRDRNLLRAFEDLISGSGLTLHYLDADLDHNRTVSAFSGEPDLLFLTLFQLCEMALPSIDLNRHTGVHPRIGALDVCPFVPLESNSFSLELLDVQIQRFAERVAMRFDLPVFLYEKSERGRHESDLPTLRKGGFGALIDRKLNPDFGPSTAHPHLGATVMGRREFLIAMNVDLKSEDLQVAKEIAKEIRMLRTEGDPRFLGVRALGLPLASRGLVQVSMNLTLPDLTAPDPIIEWIQEQATSRDVTVDGTELIGVIRTQDLPGAMRLPIKDSQIVRMVE